ncbi:MAG TPA: alanine--tRNA ligase [Candidatus Paceibacterota bacterium]|nr:alanine--tRNA ligase [Candidatus Paceibacterota bacterium]
MKTSNEIRATYLRFFEERGHAIIPSASLVPENDPTTLFTGSGMQPLLPYLLGQPHPKGKRIVDSQKSFRAADIEEVGDNRHTTFFEMLGNWSLGDYFKREQLPWFFEFLTKEVGLDPNRLYVTVFDGAEDIGVPRDEESIAIWKKLFGDVGIDAEFVSIGSEANGYVTGMHGERIFGYDEKNWWSRVGAPKNMTEGEPGGPDSEVFYDFGTPHDPKWGKECHPNCDCGRFLEIGNSVFMEYIKKDGAFQKLPQQNVDFGGGLERIVAAAKGDPDVFTIDTLGAIISALEKESGTAYAENKAAFRVVADHMRGTVFMLTDGVLPSNTDRGYFLRRLIRRATRYADVIKYPAGQLSGLARVVAASYGEHYPEVREQLSATEKAIADEEAKFRETLSRGMKEFEKLHTGDTISGRDAYVLFTTHGFPLELTHELAKERGASVDFDAFKKEMDLHRDLSRAGAEQKFKGGLADQSEATVRLHTTHHLLLKALQMVLGDHIKQRGSNITGERLRIDFSHGEKMTDEQKREVERIVNEKIKEHLPMIRSIMKREEAEKLNAQHEFGAKYPDVVSVYSLGPAGATEDNPQFDKAFSIEFCGGPHVANTSEIEKAGTFKIQKEEAVAAGIRRIKAVLQ